MINFILILLHIVACLFLTIFVLLQAGKSADLAGAFGGGSSQTAFGSRLAGNFLTRMTTVMAVIFMLTCLILSLRYNAAYSSSSTIPVEDPKAASQTSAPTPVPTKTPGTPAAQPPQPAKAAGDAGTKAVEAPPAAPTPAAPKQK